MLATEIKYNGSLKTCFEFSYLNYTTILDPYFTFIIIIIIIIIHITF